MTSRRSAGSSERAFSIANGWREAISRAEKYSVPEWDRQVRLVCVHQEHREELGRLRLAGIGADAVAVPGQLGEVLFGLVDRYRAGVVLALDLPLNKGRVA